MAGWLGRGVTVLALAFCLMVPGWAAAQKRGGTLTYATAASPGTLDPHVAGALGDVEVIHHIFETLVAMDQGYAARPMLAAAVEVDPERRRFRFSLRRNVRFHNGEVMTSADVRASFERYARVSTNGAILGDVERYETPDAHSFVVQLRRPNAIFLEQLKTPTYPLAILPADQKDRPGHEIDIIGTGPFLLDNWEKDSFLSLRRNEAYDADRRAQEPDGLAGRKTPYLKFVRYRFIADPNARLAALQSGEADMIGGLSPEIARRVAGRDDLVVQKVFPFCQQVFVTHASHGLTANPLIRQAIRAVVNIDDILAASGLPAQRNPSLLYPGSPYFTGDATRGFYDRRNPAEARALLERAGYRGEKLVLQTNATYSYMRDAILMLAEQLKEAGMRTEVQIVDWPTNIANMQRGTGKWNVTTTGFCSQPLLGPQQWKTMVTTFPHVRDDKVLEQAYDSFFSAPELAQRQAAWLAIETRVLEQAYFIKVADLGMVRAHRAQVMGMTPYFFVRLWDVWLN